MFGATRKSDGKVVAIKSMSVGKGVTKEGIYAEVGLMLQTQD